MNTNRGHDTPLSFVEPRVHELLLGHVTRVPFRRAQAVDLSRGAADLGFLVEGWLKLTRTTAGGEELILDFCGPGRVFGPCCAPLSDLRTPCRPTCRPMGLTSGLLMRVDSWAWEGLRSRYPVETRGILEALLRTRRNCIELGADLGLYDVPTRLARKLVRLTLDIDSLDVPSFLTQRDIASSIATSREVVARILADFELDGVLIRSRGRIRVRDPEGLRSLTGE